MNQEQIAHVRSIIEKALDQVEMLHDGEWHYGVVLRHSAIHFSTDRMVVHGVVASPVRQPVGAQDNGDNEEFSGRTVVACGIECLQHLRAILHERGFICYPAPLRHHDATIIEEWILKPEPHVAAIDVHLN